MIYELNHFGIVVKNLEASLSFYQDVLGAKIVYRGFVPASKLDIVYLLISDGLIELLHSPSPPESTKFGINHIAFMSNDLDADYDRITAAGYEGLMAPKTAGTGVGRLAFLSDPNGARVELIQRDLKMREVPIKHAFIRSFHHYTLITNDLESGLTFYQKFLGMTGMQNVDVPTDGERGTYLNLKDDVLQLRHDVESSSAQSKFDHFALQIDDVAGVSDAFEKKGIEARITSVNGHKNAITIFDPDGVKIKLIDRS